MPFLFIRLRPNWGFAVRLQPQSKMRETFIYPPPTTLIGALSYPLMRQSEGRKEVIQISMGKIVSSADHLRRLLKAVAASFIGGRGLTYGSYLKVNRNYRGKIEQAITALPVNIILGRSDVFLDVVYILDSVDESILRAGWGITRIGSRESIFSTEEVLSGEERKRRGKSVETRFSFEIKPNIQVEGRGSVLEVVDWRTAEIGDYTNAKKSLYFYPEQRVTVRSEEGLDFYELDLPWGREAIIA